MTQIETAIESFRWGLKEETDIKLALTRGVQDVLPETWGDNGLERQLRERKIKLYLGIDPTSPDLHIGHSVPLRKLRQFQDLGHEVNLLFGTFTGKIGDPTDKTAARVRLTDEQIATNVATYVDQAGRILDLSDESKNPVKIVYNHEWLGKLSFEEVVDLAANFSVQQMESREMFKRRREDGKPIWLHEFLYPLMQGWDSVAMGVDLEIGGKDQTFNMLVGRDLLKRYSKREKWVMAMKLIEDPNGKKMGKTEGNIVNINDWAEWKYEAIMTWPDSAISMGFELLTGIPESSLLLINEILTKTDTNPVLLKRALAYRVVYELDGRDMSDYAESEFDRVIRGRELPRRLKEVVVEPGILIDRLLVDAGLAKDLTIARDLVARQAVWVGNNQVKLGYKWTESEGILRLGKRTIKNVRKVVCG